MKFFSALLLSVAVASAPLSATAAISLAKDSDDFAFKYEQDSLSSDADVDSNGTSDFWPNNAGELPAIVGGTANFASGDFYRTDFGGSIVRNNFSADADITVEGSFKIRTDGDATGSRGSMAIFLRDSDGSGSVLYVGPSEVGILADSGYESILSVDNTDAFHTFRLARNSEGFFAWRDGSLLNPGGAAWAETGVGTSGWGLYFGDTGSTNSGSWDLDYLRIDPSASAPGAIPEPSSAILLFLGTSLAAFRRRRQR